MFERLVGGHVNWKQQPDSDGYLRRVQFRIGLALEQEQHESCRQIVELSDAGEARLIIPAYSLIEPYERIVRYAKKRTRVANDLADEVKKLLRSKSYQEETDALKM